MKPSRSTLQALKKVLPLVFAFAIAFTAMPIDAYAQQTAAGQENQRLRLFSDAIRARDAGDYQQAKQYLDQLIQIAPDDPMVKSLLDDVNRNLNGGGTAAPAAMAAPQPAARPSTMGPPPAAAGATGGNMNQADRMRMMSAAVQAEQAGDLQTAQSILQRLAAANPNDPQVRAKLASVNAKLGGGSSTGGTGRTSITRTSQPAPAGSPAQSTSSGGGSISGIAADQEAQIEKAMDDVQRARVLAQEGYFEGAHDLLTDLTTSIQDNSATRPLIKAIEEERIKVVLEMVSVTKDIEKIQEAEEYYAEYTNKYGGEHTHMAMKLRGMIDNVAQNPYNQRLRDVSPEYVIAKDEVDRLIVVGRSQFLFGDLQGAQQTLNQATAIDPDNVEAKALLTEIAKTLNEEGEWNRYRTREQMLEEVNRAWTRPAVFKRPDTGPEIKGKPPLLDKLENIKIPTVSFDGMPLNRVVDQLSALSVEYDLNSAEGDKGVNMVLMDRAAQNPPVTITLRNFTLDKVLEYVTRTVGFQYVIQDDAVLVQPGGGPGDELETRFFPISRATVIRLTGGGTETSGGGGGGGNPFATGADAFGGGGGGGSSQIDTEGKLKSFFQRAGVGFDNVPNSTLAFDGSQLIVTQTIRNLDKMQVILRRYDETKQVEIESKFLEVRQGLLEELGFDWMISNNNAGNVFNTAPVRVVNTSSAGQAINRLSPQIEQLFTQEVFVSPGAGSLSLEGIDPIVEQLTFPGDSYASNGSLVTLGEYRQLIANQLVNPDTGSTRQQLTGDAGSLRNLQNTFLTTNSTSGNGAIVANGQVLTIPNIPPSPPGAANLGGNRASMSVNFGVFDFLNIQTVVRALEQETGSDLMSSPKITVLSGKTASITVAQELIYPESYGDVEAEVSDSGGSSSGNSANVGVVVTPGTPQDFTTRNIGVELEVTPTVEDDDSISLRLEPRVTEFEGFVEYGGQAVAIAGSTTVTVPSGFFQPIFSVRHVRTEVTIYDGATVLMGGLTREEVKSVNDSIPFLGDIPLVGRLFRSEGKTQQKRNLLIFVTANLISPGGSPAKQSYRTVEANSLFQNPIIVTPGGAVNRSIDPTDVR